MIQQNLVFLFNLSVMKQAYSPVILRFGSTRRSSASQTRPHWTTRGPTILYTDVASVAVYHEV